MKDANKFGKDEFSFLDLGQEMPEFSWQNESGEIVSSETLKTKETVLILFSETCPQCIEIFDFLKQEFSSMDLTPFNIIAIARECETSQVESYLQKHSVSIQTIPDPGRHIYTKFAEKIVPRMYHFDKKGVLLASVRGYKPVRLREFLNRLNA